MKCNKCEDKNCEYRNKSIRDYIIVCSEGCTKEIREEAINISNELKYSNLVNNIKLMNNHSKTALLFNKRLKEIITIASNPII